MERLVQDFVLHFSSILWEALPFIILGAIVAGALEEFLPQKLLERLMPRSPVPAVLVGGMLGMIFPMCECGIVVVMRRLLRKGLPLSSCIAYMLAGPILNVVVLSSTFIAFFPHRLGVEMVLLRAGMGFAIACVTGLVVHRQYKKYGNALLTDAAAPPKVSGLAMAEDDEPSRKRDPLFKRLGRLSDTALHDVLDITLFLILGAALAAFAKVAFNPSDLEDFSRDMPYLAIPAMMLNAVVLCLCSEADAFVAASFTEMSVSSKLAFLVLGPMLDLKLLLMYTRVFKPRLIATLVACTVSQVLVASYLVHQVYDPRPMVGGGSSEVKALAPTPTSAR